MQILILNQDFYLKKNKINFNIQKPPEDNKWYNRVYLCYEDTNLEKPTTHLSINGFNCYRFDSFEIAESNWKKNYLYENKYTIRHTMIPICKWVPKMFDRYIVNWKLKNIYWLGKNSFDYDYNIKLNKK